MAPMGKPKKKYLHLPTRINKCIQLLFFIIVISHYHILIIIKREWDGVEDEPLAPDDTMMDDSFSPTPSFTPSSTPSFTPTPTPVTASYSPSSPSSPPPSSSLSSSSSADSLYSIAPESNFHKDNISTTLPSILETFEKMVCLKKAYLF